MVCLFFLAPNTVQVAGFRTGNNIWKKTCRHHGWYSIRMKHVRGTSSKKGGPTVSHAYSHKVLCAFLGDFKFGPTSAFYLMYMHMVHFEKLVNSQLS